MPKEKEPGTPDAGKPHVRCDEGGDTGLRARPRYSTVFSLRSLR